MHGRKRPFTEKNGDIRRSYTGSVHGHRIRDETDSVYDRILSCTAVYGRIRLRYASFFRFALKSE